MTQHEAHVAEPSPAYARSDRPPPMPARRHPLRRALAALALFAVFVLALAAGALVHLDAAPARRIATRVVNGVLASSFQGKIQVDRVAHLSLRGLGGGHLTVRDPEGRSVIVADGVSARYGAWTLARSLARGGVLRVPIYDVTVDHAEVTLVPEPDGGPSLARAFAPRAPQAPEKRETKQGGGTDIDVKRALLRHAWIHGDAGETAIDAEIAGLRAAARIAPDATRATLDGARFTLRAPLPREAQIDASGHATLPSEGRGERSAAARLSGTVGRVRVSADAQLEGDRVRAALDVPRTDAESVRELAPGAPVRADVTAHADVEGTLPELRPRLRVTLGAGALDASGRVVLPRGSEGLRADVRLDARGVDLRALAAGAPASSLAVSARVSATSRPGGALAGRYSIDAPPNRVGANTVPPLRADGAFTESRVDGELHVDEPGLPATLGFRLHPEGPGRVVDFDARVDVPDLAHVPRAGALADGGSASASARGRYDLTTSAIDARLDARAQGVKKGKLTVEKLALDATARGPAARPEVSASVTASTGPSTITARVERARLTGGVVDVPSLVIEGLGKPLTASAHLARGAARVTARAEDVDVERIAPFLGRVAPEGTPLRGHAALDADVETRGQEARGDVSFDLTAGDVARVRDLDAHVRATLDGRELDAHALVVVPGTAKVRVDASKVTLGAAPLTARAWSRAVGEIALDVNANLERVMALVPSESRPLREVHGGLAVHADAKRARAEDAPSFDATLATRGLVAQGLADAETTPEGDPVPHKPAWRTEGVDVRVHAAVDPAKDGEHLDAALFDQKGDVVTLVADARAPLRELTKGRADLRALLERAPLDAKVTVPRRALAEMPHVLGRLPLEGDAEAQLELHGAALSPDVTLAARGWKLRAPRDVGTAPFDAAIDARYDGAKGTLDAKLGRGASALAAAHADVAFAVRDVAEGRAPQWNADARAELHDFPLQAVAPLSDRQVKGALSGAITLNGLHRDATLDGAFQASCLSMGAATFSRATVRVRASGGELDARVRLDQPDGFGELRALAGIGWGADPAPHLDAARPLDVTFNAHELRAAAAKPFLGGTFSQLDGRVGANVHLRAIPSSKQGQMTGALTLTKGVVEIPALGEEFHDAHAKIVMEPWGTLKLEDVGADGITGHLDAAGSAKLDGLRPVSAEGQVKIAHGNAVPLTLEGVPYGDAWGNIDAKVSFTPDGAPSDVALNVPSFHLELPQSTGRSVQPLDPDPRISVGVHAPGPRFVLVPLEPPQKQRPPGSSHLRIAVALGDDVEVKRDTTLDVRFTGKPVVDIAQTTQLSGQIQLTRGKIEVQGKIFQIDHGIITFTGRPTDDPIVVASAYYDAPDGTRVYADFTGPVKTGKLALRSEPPHSQEEIVAILLFGSPEGSFGAAAPPGQSENAAARATGLGGSYVAQGINKAISGVTSLNVATRVDTTEANNPRPELQVQISKDVAVQAAYNLGVPGPGQNPDRTLFMIDWRFVRHWMVEATVGDRGSSWLDLLWRYRY